MSDALPPGGEPIGALHAVVLGVVEGLTEFLPISSTGHLIVANAWLGRSDPAMEVAIQAGAITAILVLYGRRLVRAVTTLATPRPDECNMLWLLAAGAAPAALLGFVLGDWIEAYLFDVRTVAWALIAGGVAL
ncbi:MAG TPA: undecaprenyl-diphosphate phosphatase, partial [Planctomycetota bacterium]|nr:undecaprenyl-diphosphate phosphatase [Planctomycetota bacterium]